MARGIHRARAREERPPVRPPNQSPYFFFSIVAVPLSATTPTGLAHEAASLPVDATPLRLALAPGGGSAALALAGGGLARVDLVPAINGPSLTLRSGSRTASTDGAAGSGDGGAGGGGDRQLSPGAVGHAVGHAAMGAVAAAVGVIPRVLFRTRSGRDVARGPTEIKALAFSADGRSLAAGGEDGAVRVHDWPSLKLKSELVVGGPGGGGGVRDVDWAGDDTVAAALDDGSVAVWSVATSRLLSTLPPPKGLPGSPSVARVRFDRVAGRRRLLAAVNAGGAGWVAAAAASAATPPVYTWTARTRLLPAPITAFDASPCGRFVGAGSADGDVRCACARTLRPAGRATKGHMIFVTAAAFETVAVRPGTKADAAAVPRFLTVSADASARVTAPRPPRALPAALLPLLLALLILALFLGELALAAPACGARRAGACAAALRAAAPARAADHLASLSGAVRDLAVASGVVGRYGAFGDRGEL